MSTRFKHHGFTLIEVLIASAIFAVLSIMAYGGLSNVIKAKEANWGETDEIRQMQMAFALMQSDLIQTINRDSLFNIEGKHVGAFFATASLFSFNRAGQPNPLDEPIGPFARVTYTLEEDTIYREVNHHPDSIASEPDFRKAILFNVEEFKVECSIDKGESWSDGCQTTSSVSYDKTANEAKGQKPAEIITYGKLPNGIRLTIVLEGMPEVVRVFEVRSGYE